MTQLTLLALFALAWVPTPVPTTPVDFDTEAPFLATDFVNNAVRADMTYKGKRLRVGGRIKSIDIDITGSPYVVLAGSAGVDVQCFFDAPERAFVASLHKDQQVTLIGECSGKPLNGVLMQHCKNGWP